MNSSAHLPVLRICPYLHRNKQRYRISSVIRRRCFLPKQSQKSRSVLQDESRSLRLFGKDKTCIIAKFHRTDLVICYHSRERKSLSYSQINQANASIESCICCKIHRITGYRKNSKIWDTSNNCHNCPKTRKV